VNRKRPYRLGRRAESQAATRRRIVEAAVDLHTSIGVGATSLSAVAERAGVQRHTLYAHFPDEAALFQACSAHWNVLHPFPDPSAWASIPDPLRRLRRALEEIYAWYGEVGEALILFTRDAHLFPELWAARRERFAAVAEGLMRGLPRRKTVRAAIGHALELETWRSLRSQGLSDKAAVDLMVRLVETAGPSNQQPFQVGGADGHAGKARVS
jgi:AcrR family transcriptional regulator